VDLAQSVRVPVAYVVTARGSSDRFALHVSVSTIPAYKFGVVGEWVRLVRLIQLWGGGLSSDGDGLVGVVVIMLKF
jgi:hypothetical protein